MPDDLDTFCNSPDIAYSPANSRELEERDERTIVLTPWTVQNICYEVLKNYMTANSPQSQGYRFSQKYDPDELKTGIGLEIAYHYKDSVIQRRPSIYVARGDTTFSFPSINQMIGGNNKESEIERFGMLTMPLDVSVVATNIGFAEQLAEYVFKIFFRYQEVIKKDFCIRQFKLVNLSAPMLYLESKDHFVVTVQMQVVFDMGAVIKGDDLKLKTAAYTIFTNCHESPLPQQ